MTARPQDVALLPLPDDWNCGACWPRAQAYARANVTAALASAQAREEELRAEVERLAALHVGYAAQAFTLTNRAERLEEALREWWEMKRPLKWSDAQHRETPCVNCATEAEYRLAKLAALSTNAATQTGETT